MGSLAAFTTTAVALGTVAMQAASLLILAALAFKPDALRPLRPYFLPLALLAALAASILTLVYSEVFGFAACFLCWVQRAFLYPVPFFIGAGLWRKWEGAWKAVVALSVPGAAVALYQHYLQVGGASLVPCPAIPGAADCAKRLVFEFGYITFPLMAATAFVFLIVLMVVYRAASRTTAS